VGEERRRGEEELGPGALATEGQRVGEDAVARFEADDSTAHPVDDARRLDA
jgi:hypothetical protein